MFFHVHDVKEMLQDLSRETRDQHIADNLAEIAPRVIANRREHQHFGPYWWWVKPLLRTTPGARRSWVRGGYRDTQFLDRVTGDTTDIVTEVTGSNQDTERWIAYLGLQYYRAEVVDDVPIATHLVEFPNHEVAQYHLYDADASQQMELFEEEPHLSAEVTQLLRDPSRISSTVWLRRADALSIEGQPWLATACLRRAVENALDRDDRSRAWLRMGEILQERGHVYKAIFCYRNAFEREQEGWVQGLMGAAWLQAGEAAKALSCYQNAIEAMPGNPEYRAGLEAAKRACGEHTHPPHLYTLVRDTSR